MAECAKGNQPLRNHQVSVPRINAAGGAGVAGEQLLEQVVEVHGAAS
ncbi:hypothetical protein [Ectopseudomonas alcaliphila]|uniref:Uncharacterized protein n=1 Tax=Ectopseudomonas alcaliphila TaxID=101564 RepID=A0ABU4PWZ5_9GAMM|nr:hypothetical protein [Pseudomonas alcaliphila]MDX5992421.1 hypothetical protein [Pseudomonas alcaliphila]